MSSRSHAHLSVRRRWRSSLVLSCLFLAMNGSAPAAATAPTHTVVIEGVQFVPATIDAKVGDKVVWVNKDPFPHTATSQTERFDSGNIQSGRSWTFTAKKKGTFAYICTLHPNMKATLVVK
jgi:plastocyanin